jgi:hypothetical protein
MMKNTLWVFGDSFSEDVYNISDKSGRKIYSKKFLKKENYKIWSELLSEKLNFKYKNKAATNGISVINFPNGNTNDDLLTNILYHCNDFKNGDIVFVGLTEISRFKLPINENTIQSISTNLFLEDFIISNEELHKICTLRADNLKFYINEFLIRMSIINKLSIKLGFTIYYWSWIREVEKYLSYIKNDYGIRCILQEIDSNYNFKYSYFSDKQNIPFNILEHTKGIIHDGHQSEVSNNLYSNIFYDYIKNN